MAIDGALQEAHMLKKQLGNLSICGGVIHLLHRMENQSSIDPHLKLSKSCFPYTPLHMDSEIKISSTKS